MIIKFQEKYVGHEYIDNILQITYVIWFQAQPCDQDLRLAANA